MPKVLIKRNVIGYPDGVHPKEYVAGECYEINESLANDFLKLGACELNDIAKKAEPEVQKNKAHKNAPKNKSELGDE